MDLKWIRYRCDLPDRFVEGEFVVTCKNSSGDATDMFGAQVHFGVVVAVGDVVVTTAV